MIRAPVVRDRNTNIVMGRFDLAHLRKAVSPEPVEGCPKVSTVDYN
jgi:hypothetical protein